MKRIKHLLRKAAEAVPGAHPFLRKVLRAVPGGRALWVALDGEAKPDFSGWGMVTHSATPWHDGGANEVSREYLAADQKLMALVKEGKFHLSQFFEVPDKMKALAELMWRHYIIFWSARYAAQATRCPVKNLVECGVCDGLTIFFAMTALKGKYDLKSYLYDAWESMKSEYLLDSEKSRAGSYSFLDIESTKRNLAAFQGETTYIKGYIPESFKGSDNPTEVVWLHLDLNSSLPTTAALEFLFEKIPPGGVILFDDYAWHDWHDTKLAVDKFFSGKPGILLPLPTGQAIFFKQ